jgi:hypothetical protein
MNNKIQDLNDIPRIVFHNLNHLLNKTNVSTMDFFKKAMQELNSYLPKNLNVSFTYLLNSDMYKDDSKEPVPLRYHAPLHPFANIPVKDFNLKSNSFFKRVLNFIPHEPTIVFFKGSGPFRIYMLVGGLSALNCRFHKSNVGQWNRILNDIHQKWMNAIFLEQEKKLAQSENNLLEVSHTFKNHVQTNNPTLKHTIQDYLCAHNNQSDQNSAFVLLPVLKEIANYYATSPSHHLIFWKFPKPNLKINGNKEKLFRACLNIIDNAIEAIQGKGKIEIFCKPKGNAVDINIKDSGDKLKDINPETLFTPFKSNKGSSGLGLSMCKKWIESMEGNILFATNPDTCFTLSLKSL